MFVRRFRSQQIPVAIRREKSTIMEDSNKHHLENAYRRRQFVRRFLLRNTLLLGAGIIAHINSGTIAASSSMRPARPSGTLSASGSASSSSADMIEPTQSHINVQNSKATQLLTSTGNTDYYAFRAQARDDVLAVLPIGPGISAGGACIGRWGGRNMFYSLPRDRSNRCVVPLRIKRPINSDLSDDEIRGLAAEFGAIGASRWTGNA